MARSKVSKKSDFTVLQTRMFDELNMLLQDMETGVKVEAYAKNSEYHQTMGKNLYVRFTDSLTSHGMDAITEQFNVGLVVYSHDPNPSFVLSERD